MPAAFANAKEVTWALGGSHWFYQNVVIYAHEKGGAGIWGKPRCVNDPELVLYQVTDYGYIWVR